MTRSHLFGALVLSLQLLNLVTARSFSLDDATPFLLCKEPRVEHAEPFLSDKNGRFISYSLPTGNRRQYNFDGQETLYINIPRKDGNMLIELHTVTIHPLEAQTEWDDDNITYSETIEEDCYYQGQVKGQPQSTAALSTCNGLDGYIQSEREEIFVESDQSDEKLHILRSCPIEQHVNAQRRSRVRRQATIGRKYMEVLIAADSSVVKFVGRNRVKTYIMANMNIVNNVYKHDSLSVDIEVIVSKILLMDRAAERSVIVKANARKTVDQFCAWTARQSYNNQLFGGGINFDVAVLLTRTGIGPAGYAPITGMCQPSRSCAVVKDEGFTSAFIVAHEVAHVIGVYHDGHGNTCQGREYQTAIMAPMVQANLRHYWWSTCSDKRMNQMLPSLSCLNNNPLSGRGQVVDPVPAGEVGWSFDQQCKYEFGEGHAACRSYHRDLCKELWCNDGTASRMCKTKRGRPLSGTPCASPGSNYACYDGACRYKGNRKAIDGGWSSWTVWGNCSVECGIGTVHRTRSCNNPTPKYGGESCDGIDEEVDTCVAQECTHYSDLRALQCSVLDSLPVRSRQHTWFPYQLDDKKKQCALTCVSNDTGEIATFEDIPVENGTPCSYEWPYNICLNGDCVSVGCDGVTNSTLNEDECGVCNGNGSQCKTIEGLFKNNLTRSNRGTDTYTFVVALPAGARNIVIKEAAASSHFIALKDPVYGRFVLNGHRQMSISKNFVAKGAWIKYTSRSNHETLKTKGPLRSELHVMVYPGDIRYPAQIQYKYTVTKDDYTYERHNYEWKYAGWTECSVTCGEGTQSLIHKCFDRNNGNKIDDEMCQYLKNPSTSPVTCVRQKCNSERFNWALTTNWTECSETCGTTGIKVNKPICEKRLSEGKYVKVTKAHCNGIPEPHHTEACNRKDCDSAVKVVRWAAARWSDCNATCEANGFQVAELSCEQESSDGILEILDVSECSSVIKPETVIECSESNCPPSEPATLYQWVLSDWGDCAGSCSESSHGIRTATLSCMAESDGGTIDISDSDNCDHLPTPDNSEVCELSNCTTNAVYRWVISDWSGCSSLCGEDGVQKLWHICEREAGGLLESVDSELCGDLPTPNKTRVCHPEPCYTYKWEVSQMGECSASCGNDGVREVTHVCEQEHDGNIVQVDNAYCNFLSKPLSSLPCNREDCFELNWKLANTSECSRTCGNAGFERLYHTCVKLLDNGTTETSVSSKECKILPPPKLYRECNRFPCTQRLYEWVHVDWNDCTKTCGESGIQIPVLSCQEVGGTVDEDPTLCGPVTRPPQARECNRKPCFREWQIGQWSECSVTCGPGIMSRSVYCSSSGEDEDVSLCPGTPPKSKRKCQSAACHFDPPCKRDRIRRICSRNASRSKCRYPGYRRMCCKTCQRYYDNKR